ncbi:MAG: tRNA guanosine(15) transglycosylase TgtA [Thermofilaceae archaeon]|nr:tRNA guanosine(15) transglycosylase TgtA [Thermofilaceae archaeon]MCX8180528.1 tRNA guanosine(15) transglycosylase TgtA [Thermofilaceae archaeon]MDW8003276.1 tRNA guanosine(15) transglycosylase TgtA [Thermofilaceae archaeon]
MTDCFEIEEVDLLGRVGELKTKSGVIETPALAPVIDPGRNVLSASEIVDLGFPLLMTNSYIIKRRYDAVALDMGVHALLGVDTPIMTDSGAYQLMEYGEVTVEPLEIVGYQVKLGSDIGVILDIPTRYGTPKDVVAEEVEETLRRAREALTVDRGGMLLVGPVQGGLYLDLVAKAGQELSSMNFDMYAVGGPVQLMSSYSYSDLVRLVMTAKMNLPPGKPLHLFGAGNPHMLALAVAMGVDTFDSASYVLYARDGRYMTPTGVYRINELGDLPCECPVCSKTTVEDLRERPSQEKVPLLALHNLYVLRGELRRIKNAVKEGRLWELLELRARGHPSLNQALREYAKYVPYVEKHHYVTKGSIRGLFFYDLLSRGRPEVFRHYSRMSDRYSPPQAEVLLIVLETKAKPSSRFGWVAELLKELRADDELRGRVQGVVLSSAYGVVPLELDLLYPLSQYESSVSLNDKEVAEELSTEAAWYAAKLKSRPKVVIVYEEGRVTAEAVAKRLRRLGFKTYLRPFKNVSDVVAFIKLVNKLG